MNKLYFCLLFCLYNISIWAQNLSIIEIKPIPNKGGEISVKIRGLERKGFRRLILAPLPIELPQCYPQKISSHIFDGMWYIDSTNTILWLGSILESNKDSLCIDLIIPTLMKESEKSQSWKLSVLNKHNKGFLNYIPQITSDSIEFVFIDDIYFKESNICKVKKMNNWKEIDVGVFKCTLKSSSSEADSNNFLLLEYPGKKEIWKLIFKALIALLGCFMVGVSFYKFPRKILRRVLQILGFVIIFLFAILFYVSDVSIFDNDTLILIASAVGYIFGIIVGHSGFVSSIRIGIRKLFSTQNLKRKM